MPPQAILNDGGEQSPQAPISVCIFFPPVKQPLGQASCLRCPVLQHFVSMTLLAFVLEWFSMSLFPCQVYKLLEGNNNALPHLPLLMPKEDPFALSLMYLALS